MPKTKARIETPQKAPAPTLQKQPDKPDKQAGPSRVAQMRAAAALPPPNGQPPAARAAGIVGTPGPPTGAVGRARMMGAMQQSVGNARLSRMMGTTVQAKLTVGAANDPYEREADRVAERVMRMPEPGGRGQLDDRKAATVQRAEEPCEGCEKQEQRRGAVGRGPQVQRQSAGGSLPAVTPQVESYLQSNKGGGRRLPDGTRAAAEAAMNHNLSGVRVHDDAAAHEAAGALNARALTYGADIYLAAGQTAQDRRLMGHELTHVVQQTGMAAAPTAAARPGTEVARRAPQNQLQADLFGSKTYTVRQVIKDDDPDQVEKLTNQQMKDASDTERYLLIVLIHRLWWVGPNDEKRLELLWDSMKDLPGMVADNFDLFKQSIEYGAELDDISQVKALQRKFEEDVEAQAYQYLARNLLLTIDEKRRLGLDKPGQPMTAEQRESVAEIQKAAKTVARAQDAQDRLRNIPVGVKKNSTPPPEGLSQPAYVPALFDPEKPPPYRSVGGYEKPELQWEQVKAQWNRLANLISGLTARHPGLYALVQGGRDPVRRAGEVTPEEARAMVGKAMDNVQTNIAKAFGKIGTPDIEYYDLKPIQEQFMSGEVVAPSKTPWSQPLYKWVADDLLKEHESREFWTQLGLGTLAAAAFIVAEFATLGSATFFIAAGVGLLASGAQAVKSWEQYLNLATLEKSQVSDEFALVAKGQASEALTEAVINTVLLFADAYAVGARGLRAAGKGAEALGKLAKSERELAEHASKEVAERRAAERLGREAAEETPALGRQLVEFVQEIMQKFVDTLKDWARAVFRRFGFRYYEVVVEGEWLVLYGIRSRVRLARIRYSEVKKVIVGNSGDIKAARHARASQLGASRAAAQQGNDVLANVLRQNAVELSEEIGELGAVEAVKKLFPSAGKPIFQGSGRGTLDLVYRMGNKIIVVEAKGGAGRIITRAAGSGRAEQGTVTYLRSLLKEMAQGPDAQVADEVLKALDSGNLLYYLCETPIPKGTAALETTLSPFVIGR